MNYVSSKQKIGWVWQKTLTAEKKIKSAQISYPKITIVTPSYNQGKFLEETIRSVILQGYENLEYFVIDGGSTDNSLEIIHKYQDYLTYWVSEPDKGQAEAINKGFNLATGDIFAFLNSDDVYLPETLAKIGKFFAEHPQIDFICGQTEFINQESLPTQGFSELFQVEINDITMTQTCHIAQPSTFFRASAWQKIGNFNQSLHYCFDYDFWLRAYLAGCKFSQSKEIFSQFRIHDASKTNTAYLEGKFDRDFITIYQSALSSTTLSLPQRKGLRSGLGIASSLLFIHLQSTKSLDVARSNLFKVIKQTPEVILSPSIWRTLLVSLTPNFIRQGWQKMKNFWSRK